VKRSPQAFLAGGALAVLSRPRDSTNEEAVCMAKDLAYDMMLEVRGLIRSFGVRTTLDRDLRVGESFDLRGRRWVVSRVDIVEKADFDRRLVAQEVEEAA
jgi:hypothetical protein